MVDIPKLISHVNFLNCWSQGIEKYEDEGRHPNIILYHMQDLKGFKTLILKLDVHALFIFD